MAKRNNVKKAKPEASKPAPAPANNDVDAGVGCALLSYLLIGIVWYFADENMKKNEFAKFHVKQAIVLLVCWIIVSIGLSILGAILGLLPIVGWVIAWILWLVFGIIFFVLWVMGIIAAATSKQKVLPIIGEYANKLKF